MVPGWIWSFLTLPGTNGAWVSSGALILVQNICYVLAAVGVDAVHLGRGGAVTGQAGAVGTGRRRPGRVERIELLRIFQVEFGISFIKTREKFEYFDPQMRPIVDTALINERGRLLLLEWRS